MPTENLLSKCFLFRNLTPAQAEKLAGISTTAHYGKGEIVFDAGQPGNAMFLIHLGSVSVTVQGKEIARLGSGSHFGEMSLVDDQPRSAAVSAAESTSIIVLARDAFQKLLATDPVLSAAIHGAFCKYLAARLRRSNEQVCFFKEQSER
ncbi:MAG TPA: cyclic nucleotide-binding domain-containing protein [Myxococcales bacterium]|jgi:CRP-like cAMP-binding protein